MGFHLGKPILVMLIAAAIAASVILLSAQPRQQTDVLVWVFAEQHANTYRASPDPLTGLTLLDLFHRETAKVARVDLLSNRALNIRLVSMFMSGLHGDDLPDVVEIEISQVGKFFRPPVDQVGFLPLNDRLKQSGWYDRIVATRFAPWSKQGVIFGVPHDVHPVTISYREDLFREAGVDLAASRTWHEFQDNCLKYQAYWHARGKTRMWSMELFESNAGFLILMLLQRGINLMDDHGNIHLDSPIVAQTLAFYAQLVAGPRQIATDAASGELAYSRDLSEGYIAAIFTPDWRVNPVRTYARGAAGKLRMMPLPVFEPGDRPTSTYGGTMMAITRGCRDPDAAWKFVELAYLRREGVEALQRETEILPPVKDWWADQTYQKPEPFYGGQRVGAMFVELAPHIPPRYVSPASAIAESTLTLILNRAVAAVKAGFVGGELERRCADWLAEGAADLRRRIEHGRFD